MGDKPERQEEAPLDRRLAGFLASKRESFPVSDAFADRVMAELRPAREAAPRGRSRAKDPGPWRRLFRAGWAAPAPRWLWGTACLGLAAAALLAMLSFGIPGPLGPLGGPAGSGGDGHPGRIRIKGGEFRFVLVVRDGDEGMRRVGEGDRLAAGDRIQVLYWLDDSAYVHLLSLDRKGEAQCYSCGSAAAKRVPGAGLPFPFALELDASPGWELFILAASTAPVDEASLKAALRKAWEDGGKNPRKVGAWLERGLPGVRFQAFLIQKGERA